MQFGGQRSSQVPSDPAKTGKDPPGGTSHGWGQHVWPSLTRNHSGVNSHLGPQEGPPRHLRLEGLDFIHTQAMPPSPDSAVLLWALSCTYCQFYSLPSSFSLFFNSQFPFHWLPNEHRLAQFAGSPWPRLLRPRIHCITWPLSLFHSTLSQNFLVPHAHLCPYCSLTNHSALVPPIPTHNWYWYSYLSDIDLFIFVYSSQWAAIKGWSFVTWPLLYVPCGSSLW